MKPSRENVFGVMARLEQAGSLPESGVTSVFISDQNGRIRRHPTQLVVRASGDAIIVRFSRLPFAKPYIYARQALKTARL